jgi:hypothetical protein
MTESPETPQNPTDEELDVEGPNESNPSHAADPRQQDDADEQDDS